MKISWNRSYNHLPRQCIRHLLFLRKEGRKWCEDRLCFLKNNFMVKDIWVHACSLSHVQLFVTPRTIACQAAQSMGCSRKEYWSGLPFPSPGVLSEPGIEPRSPALQADSLSSESPGKPSTGQKTLLNAHSVV